MPQPLYLDYNATTPVDPRVFTAMRPFLEYHFGNPSSSHPYGSEGRKAIERARELMASLLRAMPDEIIFTSGGTESNNMALKGVAWLAKERGNHIIISSVEHPAVSEVCAWLAGTGFRVTRVPVDSYGMVDPEDIERSVTQETILISVMHANNEVGTIQPIRQIGEVARSRGVLFHCDAAQSVGKILVNVNEMMVDLLSVAGHKMYAPKGVGALYVRRGVRLEKLMHGAGHESGRRAGTENVAPIVGLGAAAELIRFDGQGNLMLHPGQEDPLALCGKFFEHLKEKHPEIVLNGHPAKRLPNTLSIAFPGADAARMLFFMKGVAASAGAACHADQEEVSGVLAAMDVPIRLARGTIRFSVGRYSTMAEMDAAAEMVSDAYRKCVRGDASGRIRLTDYTTALGCACKIRPQMLERILKNLPPVKGKNVLSGFDTSDDASVYAISENQAIVQTVDIIPPVADDPRTYGAIAAANSISDIYAMGGTPLFALSVVGFPDKDLPERVLEMILKGAHEKAAEAGIEILGGHSVEDPEPRFGLTVTGLIDPAKILRNRGAKAGDVLILTKPLGTGIIMTAVKQGLAGEDAAGEAIRVMATLNRSAAEILRNYAISACTDVTGFGLLGHLREMVTGSDVSVEVEHGAVPLLPSTVKLAVSGAISGGTRNNMDFVSETVSWSSVVPEVMKSILCDAQTSGGLLCSLSREDAEACLAALQCGGVPEAAIIGRILPGTGLIHVL